MARGNSVKIRIDGDASGYEKALQSIKAKTTAGMADIKAGIDLATSAMKKFADVASKGVAYNATLESMQTSFEVMTGSAEKAAEVVERLRRMGAETPFETKDLVSTTQLLMQYGFTADDAISKMSMLGDIAQGNAQAMNSIALGYAQMSSAGKVNLVDLKQMINAGFNPLQEISERTGESMASLYDRISKGSMKVDEITESMVRATSEGGKFYQSMEKQSKTLNGQLATLKDNVDTLLGSLTEGMSEGLRNEMLPLANSMIGELQAAFEQGGMQGLTNAATEMMPELLDMMTCELEKGLLAISRWLPQGASAIMKHIPQGIRASSNIAPQITNALFEVATVVVTDLISMMPEWGPALLEGFLNTAEAALKGAVKMLDGVFMSTFSLLGLEVKKHINDLSDLSDVDTVAKISAKIDGEFDTSDLDGEESSLISRIDTLYQHVRDALTDGKPDTKEITDGLYSEVQDVVDELNRQIDEEEANAIAALDAADPEYKTKLAEIKTNYNNARTEVQVYHSAMNSFIESMAGKSTATVKANVGLIEDATDALKKAIAEYGIALHNASPESYAFKAVTAGGATNEETVGLAIDYVVAEYKVNEANILETRDQALAEAAKIAEKNPEKALELEQEAQIQFETDTQKNKEGFQKNAQAIMNGLGKTLTEEQRNALSKYSEWKNLQDGFADTFKDVYWGVMQGTLSPSEIPDEFTVGVFDLIQLGENPEAELQAFMDLLNGQLSLIDFSALRAGLALRLQEQIDAAGTATDTGIFASAWDALLGTNVIDAETLLSGTNLDSMISTAVSGISSAFTEKVSTSDPWSMPLPVDIPAESIDAAAEEGLKLGEAATSEMGDYDGANDAGDDSVDGLIDALSTAESKAKEEGRAAGRAFAAGYKETQEIASPSKVMRRMGEYTGQGLEIGLRESMARAVQVARMMSGQITTAVDIPSSMRMNMPNISNEIALANANAPTTPVYLDGVQIAEIQGHNNSTQIAWNNTRAAKGVGSR